jgi:ribosome-associated protein
MWRRGAAHVKVRIAKEYHLNTTQTDEGARLRAPHPASLRADETRGQSLQTVLASLEDSKAESTITIDIAGKSALGDHMVVTSGRSHRHVGAIADHLAKDLKHAGLGPVRVEGLPHCDWVLIDIGDIIIHIFRPEVRDFYNIEKMWSAEPYSDRRAQT